MLKRTLSLVLILVLVPHVTGCMSVKAVDLADVERPVTEEVYGVMTVAGEEVVFDEPSTDVRNDTIYATVDQRPYTIALDQVERVSLRRHDDTQSVLALVGGIAVAMVVLMGVAVSQATPSY